MIKILFDWKIKRVLYNSYCNPEQLHFHFGCYPTVVCVCVCACTSLISKNDTNMVQVRNQVFKMFSFFVTDLFGRKALE